jgi:truncated hemoglobin YjbI
MTEFEIGYYLTMTYKDELNDAVGSYLGQGKEGKKALYKKTLENPVRRRHFFQTLEKSARQDIEITAKERKEQIAVITRIAKRIKNEKEGKFNGG